MDEKLTSAPSTEQVEKKKGAERKKNKTITKETKEKLLTQIQGSNGKFIGLRSLHKHISNTDFSAYFKRMKKMYDWVEGVDYNIIKGEKRKIEYSIKFDNAIKMVEDMKITKI